MAGCYACARATRTSRATTVWRCRCPPTWRSFSAANFTANRRNRRGCVCRATATLSGLALSDFGIEYMSLEARLTETLPIQGPTYADRFHFKFMHAANGRGLEFDPILVHAHFRNELRVMKRGAGRAIFARSHHDPLT